MSETFALPQQPELDKIGIQKTSKTAEYCYSNTFPKLPLNKEETS